MVQSMKFGSSDVGDVICKYNYKAIETIILDNFVHGLKGHILLFPKLSLCWYHWHLEQTDLPKNVTLFNMMEVS